LFLAADFANYEDAHMESPVRARLESAIWRQRRSADAALVAALEKVRDGRDVHETLLPIVDDGRRGVAMLMHVFLERKGACLRQECARIERMHADCTLHVLGSSVMLALKRRYVRIGERSIYGNPCMDLSVLARRSEALSQRVDAMLARLDALHVTHARPADESAARGATATDAPGERPSVDGEEKQETKKEEEEMSVAPAENDTEDLYARLAEGIRVKRIADESALIAALEPLQTREAIEAALLACVDEGYNGMGVTAAFFIEPRGEVMREQRERIEAACEWATLRLSGFTIVLALADLVEPVVYRNLDPRMGDRMLTMSELEQRVALAEERVNEIYYSPDLPGAIDALVSARRAADCSPQPSVAAHQGGEFDKFLK
jgi:hypothetical protein